MRLVQPICHTHPDMLLGTRYKARYKTQIFLGTHGTDIEGRYKTRYILVQDIKCNPDTKARYFEPDIFNPDTKS